MADSLELRDEGLEFAYNSAALVMCRRQRQGSDRSIQAGGHETAGVRRDKDLLVMGGLIAFARDEEFLKQLFTRPHPGEDNVDIPTHLQAGKPNQIARQIDNLVRLAHIEHEDLAAVAE